MLHVLPPQFFEIEDAAIVGGPHRSAIRETESRALWSVPIPISDWMSASDLLCFFHAHSFSCDYNVIFDTCIIAQLTRLPNIHASPVKFLRSLGCGL